MINLSETTIKKAYIGQQSSEPQFTTLTSGTSNTIEMQTFRIDTSYTPGTFGNYFIIFSPTPGQDVYPNWTSYAICVQENCLYDGGTRYTLTNVATSLGNGIYEYTFSVPVYMTYGATAVGDQWNALWENIQYQSSQGGPAVTVEVEKIYLGDTLIYGDTSPAPSPYADEYLQFRITSPGNIVWNRSNSNAGAKTIQYSLDSGETWTSITSNTGGAVSFAVASGDVVYFKGVNDYYGEQSTNYYSSFSGTTAGFEVEGNILSLIYGDDFTSYTTLPSGTVRNFRYLFYECTGMTSAENLVLPENVNQYCYGQMFRNCSGLTTAPVLPATTLAQSCYANMFDYCVSLVNAPALPATTLAPYCYNQMLGYCTSLVNAPELPATTLVEYCYLRMFRQSLNLGYIKCLATDISATDCLDSWVDRVASSGTFVKAASMTSWPTGTSGIPSGWTVQDAT